MSFEKQNRADQIRKSPLLCTRFAAGAWGRRQGTTSPPANLLTHRLSNVACWEPLGANRPSASKPACPALPACLHARHGVVADGDGNTRVARLAFRPAKTTALLVIKWSGWATCWQPAIFGGMAANVGRCLGPPCLIPATSMPIYTPGASSPGILRAGFVSTTGAHSYHLDCGAIRTRAPVYVHALHETSCPIS